MDSLELELHHWLIIGGGALVVVAVACYFFFRSPKVEVPFTIVGTIAGLGLGVGLGVVLMAGFGYHYEEKEPAKNVMPFPAGQQGGGGGMMGGGGGRGMMGGGGGMMGGGGGRGMMGGGMMGGGMMGGGGPSSKTQLANLVGKLDQLTSKTLTLSLTDEQKKVIAEQTKGLLALKELDEKDAKKRLDALLEALIKNKATVEAAGFRWPAGQRGGQRPPEAPKNPFNDAKDDKNKKHLEALLEQLGKGKPAT